MFYYTYYRYIDSKTGKSINLLLVLRCYYSKPVTRIRVMEQWGDLFPTNGPTRLLESAYLYNNQIYSLIKNFIVQ